MRAEAERGSPPNITPWYDDMLKRRTVSLAGRNIWLTRPKISLSLNGVFRPTVLGDFGVAFFRRENSVIRSRAQDD
jgi:hypothetical protein